MIVIVIAIGMQFCLDVWFSCMVDEVQARKRD